MVQRLFVFSDMQFGQSLKEDEPWASEHQQIKTAFEEGRYAMPEIVYWNLAGSAAKPVTKDEENVALVSGFSPGMLKIFLKEGSLEAGHEVTPERKGSEGTENDGKKAEKMWLDPIDTMLKALGWESFTRLEVFD